MNPVLLKPQSMVGSQIVVQGKVRGTLGAANFREARRPLLLGRGVPGVRLPRRFRYPVGHGHNGSDGRARADPDPGQDEHHVPSVPLMTAISPSRLFQPIVKYSSRMARRATAPRSAERVSMPVP